MNGSLVTRGIACEKCPLAHSAQSLNVVLDLSLNIKLCDFGLTESMVPGSVCPRNVPNICSINRFE